MKTVSNNHNDHKVWPSKVFIWRGMRLPSVGCHDAAFSITFAARVVVTHAQVMAHLVGHHSGGISQSIVAEL